MLFNRKPDMALSTLFQKCDAYIQCELNLSLKIDAELSFSMAFKLPSAFLIRKLKPFTFTQHPLS